MTMSRRKHSPQPDELLTFITTVVTFTDGKTVRVESEFETVDRDIFFTDSMRHAIRAVNIGRPAGERPYGPGDVVSIALEPVSHLSEAVLGTVFREYAGLSPRPGNESGSKTDYPAQPRGPKAGDHVTGPAGTVSGYVCMSTGQSLIVWGDDGRTVRDILTGDRLTQPQPGDAPPIAFGAASGVLAGFSRRTDLPQHYPDFPAGTAIEITWSGRRVLGLFAGWSSKSGCPYGMNLRLTAVEFPDEPRASDGAGRAGGFPASLNDQYITEINGQPFLPVAQ
jgi:hypothetical protein